MCCPSAARRIVLVPYREPRAARLEAAAAPARLPRMELLYAGHRRAARISQRQRTKSSQTCLRSTRPNDCTTRWNKPNFAFVRQRKTLATGSFPCAGPPSVVKSVLDIDRQLAEIDRSFDLLLQATPVNAESAWREFRRSRFEKPPVFYYRPLAIDPALLKRQLYLIPVERIEDPTLSYLFRQKQDELDRQITLLVRRRFAAVPARKPASLRRRFRLAAANTPRSCSTACRRAAARSRRLASSLPPNSPSAPRKSSATTSSDAPISRPKFPCATICTPA